MSDSSLRSRLRKAAETRAAKFGADLIVPQVEEAYEEVLASREPGASQARLGPKRSPGATVVLTRIWKGLQAREPQLVLALTALGVAGAAVPAGGWTALRVLLVLPLALVLPGYALSRAIFRRGTPALVERIALALSLSLVTTALVSLFLYVVSVGLTEHSWAIALALVTVGATLAAAAQPVPTPDGTPSLSPRRASRALRPLPIAIALAAAALLAGAVVLARTPLSSPSARGYTALWLTREHGSGTLVLGLRSEEHRRTRYVLRLTLPGRVRKRQLALAPGQTWQERLPFTRRATASLYRVGHPGVYRSVRFRVPASGG